MISLALENSEKFQLNENDIGDQIIYGVLFMGLTPIFYQATISRKYIDRLEANETPEELIINELRIDEEFSYQEILRTSSRNFIFSGLLAIKEKIVTKKSKNL